MEREAGDLGECVHTGVSSARALGQGGFADDAAKGGLQFALNGGFAGLNLPSREVGAVVGEGEFPRLALLRRGLGSFCHGYQCR